MYKVDVHKVVHLGGERGYLRWAVDHTKRIPKPVDTDCAARDRPLERVGGGRIRTELVQSSGQQAVLGMDRSFSNIHQQKSARTICDLGLCGCRGWGI